MLAETFKNTVIRHNLITQGDHIIVALSGGADSVCLLYLMLALKQEFSLTLSAVHINHQLRGKESDRDEAFVKALCEKLEIPCFCEHFSVKDYAFTNKLGLEDAGRKIRYKFLEDYRKKLGADSIATAHHSDDNAETFLMHLLRGAGIHGLTGIPYRNGHIIRPLLDISKGEIMEYIQENSIEFVTDSTNNDTIFLRNKIRLKLLPELEKYNPAFRNTLKRNITLYQSADSYLQEIAAQRFSALATVQKNYISFSISQLRKEAEIIRYFLYTSAINALRPDFTASSARIFEIDRCVFAQSGSIAISSGLTAHIIYNNLYFLNEKHNLQRNTLEVALSLTQVVYIPNTHICFSIIEKKQTVDNTTDKNTIRLSRKKTMNHPLNIRFRRDGDYFYPYGLGHKKRLQDFFVDTKIPRFLRDEIPLLTVGGEIAWVCGYRADERFLPDEDENEIIEITFAEEKTK